MEPISRAFYVRLVGRLTPVEYEAIMYQQVALAA